MTDWLCEDPLDDVDLLAPRPRTDHALRAIDVALAALLLLAAGLPLWCLRRRIVRQRSRGKDGQPFDRLRLALPAGRGGRLLAGLGAEGWPVLLNLLRGEMAWVGPRPRALDEAAPRAATLVRPGLVNPWYVRLRTAVHFGSESHADRQYLAQRGVGHDLGLLLRGALVSLLPPPPAQVPQRVQVGDVWFDNIDMTEAVQRLRALLDGARPQQVSFVNPACVNVAAGHRGYRRALARAAMVLPDGIGIKVGSLILGTPLKQNVNGTDLFPRLCEMLQARGSSVFLLGGQPGVAEAVAAEIARRWPELRIAGLRHGYFAVAEEGDVAAQVRRSGAEVLLVARGVPSQDLFIDRYLPLLGARLALGVGGLFDFVSGRISRAPLWMRETGLEWVWRLMQEPGRMWRRYLVGNFTFLARMALQRAGLRRPAGDTLPAPRPAAAPQSAVRAVVFATDAAGADLPLAASAPVALLPVGHQSVIEHLMGHLAAAAVSDVDIVVSDQPERLRTLLADGERWGLRLRWHLVKDPARPYAALAAAARATSRRLVVLHTDHMPSARTVARLAERDRLELHALGDGAPRWTGSASAAPALLHDLPADLDRAALQRVLMAIPLPAAVADAAEGCALTSAACVLEAQRRSLTADGLGQVPASWIRRPWGVSSPLATIDPQATITGPALVGPGCWVQRGAEIGPATVLSRDVVVSRGTRVRDSLVLPGTYLGAGLDVEDAIVNGTRIRHVGLGVEMRLAESDGLVLPLDRRQAAGPGLLGRAAAASLLAVAAAPLLWHLGLRRLGGRAPAWSRRPVVTGRDPASRLPTTALLCCPRAEAQGRDAAWAAVAGLADVAAGRRCWFGMRARSVGQWYALRPEWQDALCTRPVGLLHCPAWTGDHDDAAEAEAVADVFAATLPAPALAWQWLGAARFAGRRRQRQPVARGALAATLPSR